MGKSQYQADYIPNTAEYQVVIQNHVFDIFNLEINVQ